MMDRLQKEACRHCSKNVNIGQPIAECHNCNILIHAKCFRKAGFNRINSHYFCCDCSPSIKRRYNPFENLDNLDRGFGQTDDSDKHYENDITNIFDELGTVRNLLNSCKSLRSASDFNNALEWLDVTDCNFSTLFKNIDGNKTNFDSFAVDVHQLQHDFSVVGLAETNCDPSCKDLFPLDNYCSFYQDIHPTKLKGTGVALYVHTSLNATKIDNISQCTENLESLFIQLQIGNRSYTVGVIYNPPSGDDAKFVTELSDILAKCPTKNLKIMGDFNFDLHQLAGPNSQAFEDLILEQGIYPLISVCTHVKPGCRETCIDNILSNSPSDVMVSGTIESDTSHHHAVFQLSNVTHSSVTKEAEKQYYDFCKSNVELFLRDLEKYARPLNHPFVTFEDFLEFYDRKIDEFFKLTVPILSKRNRKANPWITDGLIISIAHKEALYDDWDDSRTEDEPEGNPQLKQKYKDYRRTLKHTINAAKAKYYGIKINQNMGNLKKTWALVNELRGKRKSGIKPPFIINNQRIINRRVIANEFNKYFVSLASDMNKSKYDNASGALPINPVTCFSAFLHGAPKSSSIYMSDCTEEEVMNIINGLENGKASDIPINVIKRSAQLICPIITRGMNDCMRSGKFPDKLKIGKITPIFKKSNPEHLENYRPVSTLPIFGKIFEKVIYERLYSYLTSQNVINPQQFGFRKGHSTSHALNISVNHIINKTSSKEHVLGIFIDLSKAFDTIDHSILLHKLEYYGIRGNAHKLLESYLSNRTQFTSVLSCESDKASVIYGVPQGSVLGPLLFLIYINDLLNCSKTAMFVLFADDTNIFVSGKTYREAVEKANVVLEAVSKYMWSNKLHINLSKTCFMHFSPKGTVSKDVCQEHDVGVYLNGNQIEKVRETKFLGVIIDEKLSWDAHIKALVKKLQCANGQINRIAKFLPSDLHKTIYQTLFESHLSYGISVWGGVSEHKLSKVFTAQKHCMRILFGDKEAYMEKFKTSVRARPVQEQILGREFYELEHSKPLFNEQDVLTVHNLYNYHVLLITFKLLKLRVPISLFSCFTISSRKETLLLHPNQSENFLYSASSLWNKFRDSPEAHEISDFNVGIGLIKSKIKALILRRQKLGDSTDWHPEENFTLA